MYEDGWKVVTNHVNQLTHAERDLIDGSTDFDDDHWHLFDTRSDMAENQRRRRPNIPRSATASWPAGTRRPSATVSCPLSDGVMDRLAHLFLPVADGRGPRRAATGRTRLRGQHPDVLSNGFTITAHLGAPLATDSVGVLAEQGDYNGGWVWFADGGTLTFACSFVSEYVTSCSVDLPVGASVHARSSASPTATAWISCCDAERHRHRHRAPSARMAGAVDAELVGVAAGRSRSTAAGV